MSISNPFNTTLMPVYFRWMLVAIMASNAVAVIGYDYFIVNGIGKDLAKRWKKRKLEESEACAPAEKEIAVAE